MFSVIMDVMNVEQAKIAEEAGACAVMALGMSSLSHHHLAMDLSHRIHQLISPRANPCQHPKRWRSGEDGKSLLSLTEFCALAIAIHEQIPLLYIGV